MSESIIAYTDGACKGNGQQTDSAGGFGAHILYPNGDVLDIWGGEPSTTNNRMELMAAITALSNTPPEQPLEIWTDSNYVKNGITTWINGWKAKQWRKADGKPVLNLELWQQLDTLCQNRQIHWHWVKGHAGHAGNEAADKLANLGVNGAGTRFYPAHSSSDNPQAQNNLAHHNTTNGAVILSQNTPTTPMDNTMNDNIMNMGNTINPIHEPIPDEPIPDNPITPNDASADAIATQKTPLIISENCEQNPAYDGDTSRVNPDFWAILPPPVNRGKLERQLIMDTETTGFDEKNGDRIVEVGIIEMVGRRFTGNKLHVYINPQRQMDEEVIRVHGISNEFVSTMPAFAEVADKIYEFMVDSEVIAHNAGFDMRFLQMEFEKAGFADFSDRVQVTDTLVLARQKYPGQSNSLDALVRRLEVENRDRTFHGALLDSEILADVYLKMTSGQIALAIEDDRAGALEEQTANFSDLSQYANLLTVSACDTQADSDWRKSVLG